MGKQDLLRALSDLNKDASEITKQLKKSFKKNKASHKVRLFFKKLKAHILLTHALWNESLHISDTLDEYYKMIWLLRDAKVFRSLCKKYTHGNKLIMVLGGERVVQAKETIQQYRHTIHIKKFAKEIEQLTSQIYSAISAFDPKWIEAWLETSLEHTENLLSQLLESENITDVWFHTIRKHIKKTVYLLNYMRIYDSIKYVPVQKKYIVFSEDLWMWNDLQILVSQLASMPRANKEEKIVKKLSLKEHKMKKKLIDKLRIYFRVSPKKIVKDIQWKTIPWENKQNLSDNDIKDSTSLSKSVTKKPLVKKSVVKKPLKKNETTSKEIVFSQTKKTNTIKPKAVTPKKKTRQLTKKT